MNQDVYNALTGCVSAGISTVPAIIAKNSPAVGCKRLQKRLPNANQLAKWENHNTADAIAVITGEVSGNLEIIVFDDAGETWSDWEEKVRQASPSLLSRLVIEQTPSGNRHVVYRCDAEVGDSTVLAQRPNDAGEPVTLIETRGEGGFCLCCPSSGYESTQGDLAAVPTLTTEERDVLLAAARDLDEIQPVSSGESDSDEAVSETDSDSEQPVAEADASSEESVPEIVDCLILSEQALEKMDPAVVAEAEAMLRSEDLMDQIMRDIETVGVIGEESLVKTIYLVGTSRLLEQPLSLIVQGTTSSGKSYSVEKTMKLMPSEAVLQTTSMTPQSLYHMPQGTLKHRIIAAGERSRRTGDDAAETTRALREIISSGRLSKTMVAMVNGQRTTVRIEQEGPIVYIETTTLDEVFEEDRNRCICVQTNECSEQTERIIQGLAQRAQGDSVVEDAGAVIQRHYAIQRLLRQKPVVIPFAASLAERVPTNRVEMRRAFRHFLAMIQAHCLLFQYQRGEQNGALIATCEDYEAAFELLRAPFAQRLRNACDASALRFHERLLERFRGREFSTKEAVQMENEHGSGGKSSVHNWLRKLSEHGLVREIRSGRGNQSARWIVEDGSPEERAVLPTPEDLFADFDCEAAVAAETSPSVDSRPQSGSDEDPGVIDDESEADSEQQAPEGSEDPVIVSERLTENLALPLTVYSCKKKRGIIRSGEFEKKGLATHAVNVGLKCGHACRYCSTPAILRTHKVFGEIGRTSFAPGIAVVDAATPERIGKNIPRLTEENVIQLCTLDDAWSPEARRHDLGRRCLEVLLNQTPAQIRVLTKSHHIQDDFDLMGQFRDRVIVGLSTGTPASREEIARVLEPNASSISDRLTALKRAHEEGLRTFGMLCPVFPGVGDSREALEEMFDAVLECGVEAIWSETVNARGNSLTLCNEALRLAGQTQAAEAVDEIRAGANWSRYATALVRETIAVAESKECLENLSILLYPSRLSQEDKTELESLERGIVWL